MLFLLAVLVVGIALMCVGLVLVLLSFRQRRDEESTWAWKNISVTFKSPGLPLVALGLFAVMVAALRWVPHANSAPTTPPPRSLSSSPPSFSPPAIGSGHVSERRIVVLTASPTQDSLDIDYWRQPGDESGDLRMDPQGIFTQKSASLAMVPDAPDATYGSCSQAQNWVGRVDFSQLHVGSQLCAHSFTGRYASMRVTSMPSQTAAWQFVFHGIVWDGP